jgi:hypothetical protein
MSFVNMTITTPPELYFDIIFAGGKVGNRPSLIAQPPDLD